MQRFELEFVSSDLGASYWAWDSLMKRVVPGSVSLVQEASQFIVDSMNQRVERPELTRADGKLVTV